MDASKTASAKQLKEHLQDQQEPFTLDSYLSERRFMIKDFSSDNRNVSCPVCSAKKLNLSSKYDLYKTRNRILHAIGILRSALHKFIYTNDVQECSNCNVGHESGSESVHVPKARNQTTAERYGVPSMKGMAAPHSGEVSFLCYKHHISSFLKMFQTFTFSKLKKLETATDTIHGIITEDTRQGSRNSELKQSAFIEVCHFRLSQGARETSVPILPKKPTRDPIFSASLSELLVNPEIPKDRRVGYVQKIIGIFFLIRRNRRMLQRRKQLQIDFLKGHIEFRGRKAESQHMKEFLKPEDFRTIIHKQIPLWRKQSGEVRSHIHLMSVNILVTSEEWRNFQKLNRKIGMEIGDAIMDDIFKEIMNLFFRFTGEILEHNSWEHFQNPLQNLA
ncbi:DUF4378 domain-containing protein [Quillaja saponaria]|uniref:DUF4378 domain-containing protein n=1 Tax=Quillaja saponaria TaxID=32244 RepID=A0AAD7PU77_QUISA|nr:DUF4378 domain-containing protein [Quillaja saponaria]